MSRWLLSVLLLGLVLAAAMARPGGRGGSRGRGGPGGQGGPGSRGDPMGRGGPGGRSRGPWRFGFGRPRPDPFDGDHEKAFFCQAARKACRLEATADGAMLVDRACVDGTPCEDGDTGRMTLGGTEYEVTFCPRPAADADPLLVLINKERREEPSAALQAICPLPERPDRPQRPSVPFWYHFACKVTTPSGEEVKQERGCQEDYTCSKGPYNATYEDQDVQATFCDYPRRQKSSEEEEQDPFWYKSACQVADSQGAVLEQDDCPRDLTCSVRLTDMTDDNLEVSFCDGLPLGKPGHGRRGHGRPGHGRRGDKGRHSSSEEEEEGEGKDGGSGEEEKGGDGGENGQLP